MYNTIYPFWRKVWGGSYLFKGNIFPRNGKAQSFFLKNWAKILTEEDFVCYR